MQRPNSAQPKSVPELNRYTTISRNSLLLAFGLLTLAADLFSQKTTPADARLQGFEQHKNLKQNTLLGSRSSLFFAT